MTRQVLVLLALAVFAGSASAEALELKGFRLGAPEGDLVTKYASIQCQDQQSGPAERMCIVLASSTTDLLTLAEQPVKFWSFFFRESRLGLIVCNLPNDHFREVAEAFEAKYGKPKSKESVMQNRMGAKFTNTTLEWLRGDEILTVQQYGGDISTMIVSLGNRKFVTAPTPGPKTEKRAKDL